MIVLSFSGAEELAEAIYLAEVTATVLALGTPPRGNLWGSLDPEAKAIKIAAAKRLITLYQVEGMTTDTALVLLEMEQRMLDRIDEADL